MFSEHNHETLLIYCALQSIVKEAVNLKFNQFHNCYKYFQVVNFGTY